MMFAQELISTDIFPLKKTDTCESALVFMNDWKIFHLPITDNGKLIGYVFHDEIALKLGKEKIEKYIQPLVQLYVTKEQHIFEIIKLFADTSYTCVAVSDEEANFFGAITLKEIIQSYNTSSLAQPGGIVVLLMNPQDYSLAELARIIEYNDVKILQVFVKADSSNPLKILVSLKLNRSELGTVIQTLERYQYQIHSVHQTVEQLTDFSNRYNWLIKYLNT